METYYACGLSVIDRMTASAQFSYRPLTWLTHRFNVGTDITDEENTELRPYQTNDTIRFFWGANLANGFEAHARRHQTFNTFDYSGAANFDVQAGPSLQHHAGCAVLSTAHRIRVHVGRRVRGAGAGRWWKPRRATELPAKITWTTTRWACSRSSNSRGGIGCILTGGAARRQQQRVRRGHRLGDLSQGHAVLGTERRAVLPQQRTAVAQYAEAARGLR